MNIEIVIMRDGKRRKVGDSINAEISSLINEMADIDGFYRQHVYDHFDGIIISSITSYLRDRIRCIKYNMISGRE